jgi:hypothetical protein
MRETSGSGITLPPGRRKKPLTRFRIDQYEQLHATPALWD